MMLALDLHGYHAAGLHWGATAARPPSWHSVDQHVRESHMTRFPTHDIISLVGAAPRYDLGESTGPDMRLAALLEAAGQGSLGDMPLAYATAAGDPLLRQAIAEAHGVHADDVVVTMG